MCSFGSQNQNSCWRQTGVVLTYAIGISVKSRSLLSWVWWCIRIDFLFILTSLGIGSFLGASKVTSRKSMRYLSWARVCILRKSKSLDHIFKNYDFGSLFWTILLKGMWPGSSSNCYDQNLIEEKKSILCLLKKSGLYSIHCQCDSLEYPRFPLCTNTLSSPLLSASTSDF